MKRIFTVQVRGSESLERKNVVKTSAENVGGDAPAKKQPIRKKKIGRNEPCPCGSGKKYKNCCGRNA